MLYEEWKSRYKNLKNFNTVLQRCPKFWPLAPPRGMNPGVYSLGISEDPPRYLSSKFDASVRSDCWDISIWKTLTQCDGNGNANANANANDRGDYNSSPCTSYRRAKNNQEILIYKIFHVKCNIQILNLWPVVNGRFREGGEVGEGLGGFSRTLLRVQIWPNVTVGGWACNEWKFWTSL